MISLTGISTIDYAKSMNDIRNGRGVFSRNPTPQVRPGLSGQGAANSAATGTLSSGGTKGSGKQAEARSNRRMKLLLAAGGALIVVLVATSGFLFWQYRSLSNGDDEAADAVSQRIIDKVDGLYLVPEGEDPTVAEIRDKSKLKDQAFFNNAQNGDYLLVYEQAGIALIYRESAGKLVNASPVGAAQDIDANSQQGASEEAPASGQ